MQPRQVARSFDAYLQAQRGTAKRRGLGSTEDRRSLSMGDLICAGFIQNVYVLIFFLPLRYRRPQIINPILWKRYFIHRIYVSIMCSARLDCAWQSPQQSQAMHTLVLKIALEKRFSR